MIHVVFDFDELPVGSLAQLNIVGNLHYAVGVVAVTSLAGKSFRCEMVLQKISFVLRRRYTPSQALPCLEGIKANRCTFGTHLSKGGVSPRTAQAAMRHSYVDLTMNVYTDPKLLDVHGAIDAIPQMPLDGKPDERERATGTAGVADWPARTVAPTVAPDSDKGRILGSSGDNRDNPTFKHDDDAAHVVSRDTDKRKHPPSTADNEWHIVGLTGIEPATSASRK